MDSREAFQPGRENLGVSELIRILAEAVLFV
jgi:hypothetical protein